MARKLNYKKLLYVLLIAFLLVVTIIGGRGMFPAFADTVSYSNVLEDLKKDSTFQVSAYPDNAKDYSINVIQIAEGGYGELFLYTYQPCQKTKYLIATEINMSLEPDKVIADNTGSAGNSGNTGNTDNTGSSTGNGNSGTNGDGTGGSVGGGFGGGGGHGRSAESTSSKPYSLKLVSCSDVFAKYIVNDFTVSNSATRYYNITSVYRKWDKNIDEGTGNDNTKESVAFKVGKCYIATTVNGEVSYKWKETETILITDKYIDYLQYKNGWLTYKGWTDSHYIAFSTDKQIDTLVEADVYFTTQRLRLRYNLFTNDYKEVYAWNPEENTVTLNYEYSKGGNSASGLFSKKYDWQCVQSVTEFKSSVRADGMALTDEAENNLKNKQWVLRFYESEYEYFESTNDTYKTRVTDVTILRLKFETNGKTYDLGVVDNKQSGDDVPGNIQDPIIGGDNKDNSSDWFTKFFKYVWNCVAKLFAGNSNVIETVVAVIAIIVAVVVALGVFACAVAFIKWFYRKVFK